MRDLSLLGVYQEQRPAKVHEQSLPTDGLVSRGHEAISYHHHSSLRQALLQDAQKRQVVPSRGMEGCWRPSECHLHHFMETSLHCQRAKSQEPHRDLPMLGCRRRLTDFFDGSSRAFRTPTGTSATKFLLRRFQIGSSAGNFFRSSKILLKERIITVRAAANEREFSSQDFSFFSLAYLHRFAKTKKLWATLQKCTAILHILQFTMNNHKNSNAMKMMKQ